MDKNPSDELKVNYVAVNVHDLRVGQVYWMHFLIKGSTYNSSLIFLLGFDNFVVQSATGNFPCTRISFWDMEKRQLYNYDLFLPYLSEVK